MVLRQGDDVLGELAALAANNRIPAATFFGLGFVAEARFGFFDFEIKDYVPRSYHDLEMASFTGSLAWKGGQPSVHAHGMGCDRSFGAVGGHVLGLTVGRGSFEITVLVHERRLERAMDAAIGANVLQL